MYRTSRRGLGREHVEAAEPLLEVSDGVTSTQILAPAASILRDIATAENETAPVGTQLAVIATDDRPTNWSVA
jgi:pyruvate dehydrogenase E2 component (dihydrolipoamide acetyltransferase)